MSADASPRGEHWIHEPTDVEAMCLWEAETFEGGGETFRVKATAPDPG